MNESETLVLLAKVKAYDNRNVEPEVHGPLWLEILEPYRLGDCLAALVQFKEDEPGVWVEPGHLKQIIDHWREQWHWKYGDTPMPVGGRVPRDQLISGEEFGARVAARQRQQQINSTGSLALPGIGSAKDGE